MMLARLAASIAPYVVSGKRLAIFTFHRVLHAHDSLLPDYPDAARFYREMVWLQQTFRFLAPEEACDRLYDGTLPDRAAVLTLDDGYEENFTVVNPILTELRIPAAYFIATRFLGSNLMFNDRLNEAIRMSSSAEIDLSFINQGVRPIVSIAQKRDVLARLVPFVKYQGLEDREALVLRIESICAPSPSGVRMLDEQQIRQTSRLGITIGAHTRNHPILRLLSDKQSIDEIQGSLDDISGMLGEKPTLFAYPNGRYMDDFEDRHCEILEGRVKYAFATGGGANSAQTNKYRLARNSPWGRQKWMYQLRQVKAMFVPDTP